MKLTLPFPPSVNGYWRATNTGMKISASGRSFRSNAIAAILTQLKRRPQLITVNVEVTLLLYPPDKHNRDLDNYQKGLFETLTREYCGKMKSLAKNLGRWFEDFDELSQINLL